MIEAAADIKIRHRVLQYVIPLPLRSTQIPICSRTLAFLNHLFTGYTSEIPFRLKNRVTNERPFIPFSSRTPISKAAVRTDSAKQD